MIIKFNRLKNGLKSAVTMSYDDGEVMDRQLIEIFNKHGIKGSFHLNSSKLGQEKNVTADEIKSLYAGHEVSVHTLTHPRLEQLSTTEIIKEVMLDRKNLEAACGYPVRGMSYPFGTYNDDVISTLKQCGIVCSRTTQATRSFKFPTDFMAWHPTCHHGECLELADKFFEQHNSARSWTFPLLFYVWGHSYEFPGHWDLIEQFCEKVGGRDDIWYATNIEIYEYMTALKGLVISTDSNIIYNPSATDVWISCDNETVKIPGGATVTL